MADYRLFATAQADIVDILAWTHERFGEQARLRYEHLLVTALRDVAAEVLHDVMEIVRHLPADYGDE